MMDHMDQATFHEEGDVKEGLVVNFTTKNPSVVGAISNLQFFVNEKPAGTLLVTLEPEFGVTVPTNVFVTFGPAGKEAKNPVPTGMLKAPQVPPTLETPVNEEPVQI